MQESPAKDGFVAVAVMDDGSYAIPLHVPVRATVRAAWDDRGHIEMVRGFGPVYRNSRQERSTTSDTTRCAC